MATEQGFDSSAGESLREFFRSTGLCFKKTQPFMLVSSNAKTGHSAGGNLQPEKQERLVVK